MNLRNYLIYATILTFIVILIGSGINNKALKYSITTNYDSSCKSTGQIYIRNIVDSYFCCDRKAESNSQTNISGYYSNDWICISASDKITKILCSRWAMILPLTAWLINCIFEFILTLLLNSTKSIRKLKEFGVAGIYRLTFHLFLIVFRTMFLFMFLNFILISPDNSSSCWYIELTKDKKCKDNFDFSDHIVLMYSQYILPTIIEIAYVDQISSSLTPIKRYIWLTISYSVAIIIIFLSIRVVFFTSLFYHTPIESLSGLMLAVITSGLFVYLLDDSTIWKNLFLRDYNFRHNKQFIEIT